MRTSDSQRSSWSVPSTQGPSQWRRHLDSHARPNTCLTGGALLRRTAVQSTTYGKLATNKKTSKPRSRKRLARRRVKFTKSTRAKSSRNFCMERAERVSPPLHRVPAPPTIKISRQVCGCPLGTAYSVRPRVPQALPPTAERPPNRQPRKAPKLILIIYINSKRRMPST